MTHVVPCKLSNYLNVCNKSYNLFVSNVDVYASHHLFSYFFITNYTGTNIHSKFFDNNAKHLLLAMARFKLLWQPTTKNGLPPTMVKTIHGWM